MSAGILENDQMFSVKERPWHGLGVVVEKAPTIEEAIELANLGWEVQKTDIQTLDGTQIPDKKAMMRMDTKQCLGIVGNGYNVLQNKEAFKFFEPFIDNELATLETAGSLFNGKRVFILAKIAGEDMVIDEKTNDRVEKYILLSNSHDGSQAVKVGYCPIRVVCNNTLTAAESSSNSQLIRVYHKSNVVQTLQEIQETMDLVNRQFITTEEKYKQLAQMNVNTGDLQKYVKAVFSKKKLEQMYETPSEHSTEEVEKFRKKLMEHVEEVFEKELVHNRWTMYNAVNHYLNHGRSRNLQSTYNSLWFGDAKRLDKKALELAFNI